jgi:hypothetical protein
VIDTQGQGIPREHFSNRRDKAYELFLHYSTIRLAIIAFVIPFGGEIVARGEEGAGYFLIGLAVVVNWFFASYSLNLAIKYKHLEQWLKHQVSDPLTGSPEDLSLRLISPYWRVVTGRSPLEGSTALSEWGRMEPMIQGALVVGVGLFAYLLQ